MVCGPHLPQNKLANTHTAEYQLRVNAVICDDLYVYCACACIVMLQCLCLVMVSQLGCENI